MSEPTYRISEDPAGVSIELSDVAGKEEHLLEAFRECEEGRCTCPTAEYQKVAAMDVYAGADAIEIRLDAKPGAQLDRAEIERCLDYTVTTTAGATVGEAPQPALK